MRWLALAGTFLLSVSLAVWAWLATPRETLVHTVLLRPQTFWSQWLVDRGLVLEEGPLVSRLSVVALEVDQAPPALVEQLVGDDEQRFAAAYRGWAALHVRWIVPSSSQLFVSVRHTDPSIAGEVGRRLAERAAAIEFDELAERLEDRRQLWREELALVPDLPAPSGATPDSVSEATEEQSELQARVAALDRYSERITGRLGSARGETEKVRLEALLDRTAWQRERLVDPDLVRALGVVDRGSDVLSARRRELQSDMALAGRWLELGDDAQRVAIQLDVGQEAGTTPVERNVWLLIAVALLLPWLGLVGAQLLVERRADRP